MLTHFFPHKKTEAKRQKRCAQGHVAVRKGAAPELGSSDRALQRASRRRPPCLRSGGSGEQSWSLKGKTQLVHFSVVRILQLQPFVLCEICSNPFP